MSLSHAVDILIIGAGQAGLALGHALAGGPWQYQLLERHSRVGESWRLRYDSLVLFTPRSYSALPGMAVPGDPESYPSKDEIADYLETYAARFALPIETSTGVRSLVRTTTGFRAVTDAGRSIDARGVVIATGAFQEPSIPACARGLDDGVLQLTAESYRNPAQIPAAARILVAGDGATGRQIALELANAARTVTLATGKRRVAARERWLGKSTFWWLDRLGLLAASRDSWMGRLLRAKDPFPGRHLALKRLAAAGVRIAGRVEGAHGQQVRLADAASIEVDAVIWATGYSDRTRWVDIPGATDTQGRFVENRGISPVPGLFFIGRAWQRTRGSALLHGVGADAAYVAAAIAEHFEGAGTRGRRRSTSSTFTVETPGGVEWMSCAS